jgi:hypothetical protein
MESGWWLATFSGDEDFMPVRMVFILSSCFLLLGFMYSKSPAHEVDQYSPPAGQSLRDLGTYWNQLIYRVVLDGVKQANQDIASTKNSWLPDPGGSRMANSQSPNTLAKCVRAQLPSAMDMIENMEHKIAATDGRDVASGQLLAYRPKATQSVYLPATQIRGMRYWNRLLFMRSSTIKVHGHYIGTDKIGHFFAMGYYYYNAYQAAQLLGHTHAESLQKASDICGWTTENSFLGMTSTAIYSNADLAANYLGLKFYLNLCHPVKIAGHLESALVVREGDYWKIRDRLNQNSPLFSKYVSAHWDEVLNPCHLEESFREHARKEIYARRELLLDWYAGNDPRRRTKVYFDNILAHTKTYYGENYGHSGPEAHQLGIGTICFESVAESPAIVVRGNQRQMTFRKPTSGRKVPRNKNTSLRVGGDTAR